MEKLEQDGDVGERVAAATQQVQEKVGEVGERASVRLNAEIDRRSTEVGDHLGSMARALHRAGESLRDDERSKSATKTDQAADGLERLGTYLRTTEPERILADVEMAARRRPWLTAGTGLVAGFVAARFLKASSANRYAQQRNGRPELERALAGRTLEAGQGITR